MKASELKRALTFINDDAEIEFVVENDGSAYVAEPIEATVTTDWEIPKRGELTSFDDNISQTNNHPFGGNQSKGDLS